MTPTPIGQDPGAQDTQRLMMTMVLVTALFAVWNLFLAPKPPPPAGADGGPVVEGPLAEAPPPRPSAEPVAADPVVDHGGTRDDLPAQRIEFRRKVQRAEGQTNRMIRGGYHAVLSSHGARVVSFELPGYGDPARTDVESGEVPRFNLVDDPAKGLLSLRSTEGVKIDEAAPYEVVFHDEHKAVFRRTTAEGLRISRTYELEEGRYGFKHQLRLENIGATSLTVAPAIALNVERSGGGGGLFDSAAATGDPVACSLAKGSEEFDAGRESFELEELKEDGPASLGGVIDYVATSSQYFLAALLPDEQETTRGCTATYYRPEPTAEQAKRGLIPDGVTVELIHQAMQLGPGETRTLGHNAFLGPKQLQLLEDEGRKLDENIEFGIFGVISRPILWTLIKLYDYFGNFGWAIIVLTLLIKLLTFPLTQKSYVSMQQMKVLAPELKKLQAKYGHDRAVLGQKQMDMYKEKGINPLAGCLPVLIQMPIWFALYRTLWNSVELYQQPFVSWITDLSQPDIFPAIDFPVLPFVVGLLMLFQTLMQPAPQDQPQMKYILWAMPVMFTVFMFGMPSGLSIYMITNSTLTMFQQLYIRKKYAAPEPESA